VCALQTVRDFFPGQRMDVVVIPNCEDPETSPKINNAIKSMLPFAQSAPLNKADSVELTAMQFVALQQRILNDIKQNRSLRGRGHTDEIFKYALCFSFRFWT
jgi:hypothetical protein